MYSMIYAQTVSSNPVIAVSIDIKNGFRVFIDRCAWALSCQHTALSVCYL